MPEMEQQIGQQGKNRRPEVVGDVTFDLGKGRIVTLSQEPGNNHQLPNMDAVWVARGSDGGVRISLDPQTALSRFTSSSRAERMLVAADVFIPESSIQ